MKRLLTSIGYWLIALGCEHDWQIVNREFAFCQRCDKVLNGEQSAKMFDAEGMVQPQFARDWLYLRCTDLPRRTDSFEIRRIPKCISVTF